MAAVPIVITDEPVKDPATRDLLRSKTPEEIKTIWQTLSTSVDVSYRDELVSEMMRRGINPLEWLRERDMELGLYPDAEDPEFARRLYKKTEFASLSSYAVAEDTCSKSRQMFETTAVQRLVARFLHPSTPYRGLLLNHGVGVGKTCSAITVAETYLEIAPHNKVFLLAPQAIADGFRKTIFDVDKLVKLTKEEQVDAGGDVWRSPQCTGMTYLRLTGNAGNESKEDIERDVARVVRQRYKIMGYLAFANWVQGEMDKIPSHIQGAARKDMINAMLMDLFADHLVIIDEAHNLRDAAADSNIVDDPDATALNEVEEGKKLTPILKQILEVCEGLRLLLMTATPMYNTAPEILHLLNLLILNDTKDRKQELVSRDVFSKDGNLIDGGATILAKYIKRYVSYMRGENPNTFPLRLTPPEHAGQKFMDEYPGYSISRREGEVVLTERDVDILKELPLIVHKLGADSHVGSALLRVISEHVKRGAAAGAAMVEEGGGATEVTDMILDNSMQIGNLLYPDGTYGRTGWNSYFSAQNDIFAGNKVQSFSWIGEEPIESVFAGDGLRMHAPKIAAILESIQKAKGMSFVFSRYVQSGALPIAIALELAGWCRVLADGTPAPLLRRAAGAPKPKHFYILLTSNSSISPQFKGLLEYATTLTGEQAAKGSKVKAILGSQIASEGLDLKCIRELHLLDGWYHLNRIEQIEGRGVRYCSHVQLPLEERNCLIYLHAVSVPDYETADLYAYRLAVRKAQPIGEVTRLMKINAWDCMLNRDAILLRDLGTRRIVDAQGRVIEEYELEDRPFTSFCDFSDNCEYKCANKLRKEEKATNKSTYEEYDYRRKFAEKEEILKLLFADETALPLSTLKETTFRDMPWSMAAIGLRDMLGRIRIRRDDGIGGTLVLKNGYIVFQPAEVTDVDIPLALRYGRAYGHLARSVLPTRGSILQVAAPAVAAAPVISTTTATTAGAAAAGAADAAVAAAAAAAAAADKQSKDDLEDERTLRDAAENSLTHWMTIVDGCMKTEKGVIPAPEGFDLKTFLGWRWVLYHFRALGKDTELFAAKWWMDNLWSPAQKIAVFKDWTARSATLTGVEKEYADLWRPSELFSKRSTSGFLVFDPEKIAKKEPLPVLRYCFNPRTSDVDICPSNMNDIVDGIIGAAPHRDDDTGEIYGFLTTNKGVVISKALHKPTAGGSYKGSECQNNSVLAGPILRIGSATQQIMELAGTDPIVSLLLDVRKDTEPPKAVRKTRQTDLEARFEGHAKAGKEAPQHVVDLTHKQICPYLEFLLRYMDRKKMGGKRWFLSLVENARSGPKRAEMS